MLSGFTVLLNDVLIPSSVAVHTSELYTQLILLAEVQQVEACTSAGFKLDQQMQA